MLGLVGFFLKVGRMGLKIAAAGPDCESDRKSGVRLLTDVVEKGARDFRRLQGSPSANPGYSQRRKRTEHGFYCPVA
jgi:hypothetical protein